MILRDPGAGAGDGSGGGGGGGNTFLASLPTELQQEGSLATFKDAGTLAKSYVEAQKLIGSKRIALPGEKASDTEWDAFYNSIGRPETADKYEIPQVALEPEIKLDEAKVGLTKKELHKLGLTPRQASGVMKHYLENLNESFKLTKAATASQGTQATAGLRQEWGDAFDSNVEVARSVIKKFGDAETSKFLDDSGLGNNVQLVKMLQKIGASILEDTGRRGGDAGGSLPLNNQARATQEIDALKVDKEFQTALGDPRNPGHRAAVERWTGLFMVAHPGQQSG